LLSTGINLPLFSPLSDFVLIIYYMEFYIGVYTSLIEVEVFWLVALCSVAVGYPEDGGSMGL